MGWGVMVTQSAWRDFEGKRERKLRNARYKGCWNLGCGQQVTRRSLRRSSTMTSSISDCTHTPERQGLRCTMLAPAQPAGAVSPFVRMGSF